MTDKITITATYDKDTLRTHRYLIDEGQEIRGTLYVPKDMDSVPKEITIELKVK